MDYYGLLSYLSAGTNSAMCVIQYQTHLEGKPFVVIWKALFLLPVVIIEAALWIVMLVYSLLGKLILLIPILNVIYAAIFEVCLHYVAFFIGLIGNLLTASHYCDDMRLAYEQDLQEARSYIQ